MIKRVLLAPLDWGLGHATRCIPIIRLLQNKGCEVMIAGNGDSLVLLRKEFPEIRYFNISGYDPVYPRAAAMIWKMMTQLPKFYKTIQAEHREIESLIRQHQIDLVISDNRYGCWSEQVPSVFITHQSNILMPKRFGWLQRLVRNQNENYMKRYTACWLPDFPDEHSLAGDLISFGSAREKISVEYIGALSRFSPSQHTEKKYDVIAVCSGPEPQRSLLEAIIAPQLQSSGLECFLVGGKPSSEKASSSDRADFLATKELQRVLESSDVVVARSGYSTIMDMAALHKKVIFIPTPGQTEQEYLAQRLKDKGIAFYMNQHDFNLAVALRETECFSGFKNSSGDLTLLELAVDKALKY
ncbi:MAG: glycosyltransferase [Bacteroidota bacterium]